MDSEIFKNFNRVIVTGGSGFIGSHLADKAHKLGYRVDVIALNKPASHIINKNIV